MTRNADAIGPRERRFLAFVSEMYQEAQRLELKGPYQIVCNDTNGRELFQTKVIGTDGTIVNLETPWKEVEDHEVVEINFRPEDGGHTMTQILDLQKDENASAAPASGKSEPATRKAAAR